MRTRTREIYELRAENDRLKFLADALNPSAAMPSHPAVIIPGIQPAPLSSIPAAPSAPKPTTPVMPSPNPAPISSATPGVLPFVGPGSDLVAQPASLPVVRPTSPAMAVPLKEITIARGSGGIDDDRQPGDEGLLVIVSPKDEDGEAVKVIASLVIRVEEITNQGVKLPIGTWDVPVGTLRKTWQNGLFSTGFHVKLGWKTPPRTEKIRVTVQMILPDRRIFEADRELRVVPIDASGKTVIQSPSIPTASESSGPLLPSSATTPARINDYRTNRPNFPNVRPESVQLFPPDLGNRP
ncbi:hypothetical protein [Tuwongella immobilis]|uniref:hypothetical protein n=1 Tax=Tuwongella immobilis TaxID=692036 RepID=UPI0013A68DCC|nr:hypothetical protein [Tuwongella immobilis]